MSETTATSRRLFVNGEALRIDVTAPRPGGGTKYEPQTVDEARALLLPQIALAARDAHTIPSSLRRPDRVYVEARLLPNYLAPTYFPSELLGRIGAVPVGSRADIGTYRTATKTSKEATRRLVFSVTDTGLDALTSLVEAGGRTRTDQQALDELRRLEDFALPALERVLRSAPAETAGGMGSEPRTWEVVLHPAAAAGEPEPLDEATLGLFAALVDSCGGTLVHDYTRVVGGLTFVPVVASADAAPRLAAFNPLRAIRPMPAIPPRPRFGVRSVARLDPPAAPGPLVSDVSVAVFDGGVDLSRGPSAHIPARTVDLTPMPPATDCTDHGTGVTAAALFGLVEPGQVAPQPPLPVTSYRVLPPPATPGDVHGYWVLDQVKSIVETERPRIVNLSLGPTLAVEDDQEPNRWTAELDQLAWDNDVLFVVAAGNDGEADQATGLHRVQVPADMANGLAVGACDAPAPESPWHRAPYSSMGPGRTGNRVQPAGVQFGGVDDRMFPIVRADGSFLEATGTSFSAPVTTHALADLVTRLPRSNASVLRAFAVHFAERHRTFVKLKDELGHGRQPLSFADALDSGPGEVAALFVDEVTRGELIGYQLPVPAGLVGKLKLRLTLAYASPVEPSQPTEYTSASIDLTFRPHMFTYRLTPPRGTDAKAEVLDLRSVEARGLLEAGWTPSQEPVTATLTPGLGPRSPEIDLRESGKWETVRRHELTVSGADLLEPRLELGYVARRSGALDRSPTKVPFALIVSVIDSSPGSDLHDRVAAEFAALRPVQRVRGQLRLRSQHTETWY